MSHVGTSRLPASHNSSKRFLFQSFGNQRLIAKSWLSSFRLVAELCPQRDIRNKTRLGQRSRVDGWATETHSLLEDTHVSCVRAPVFQAAAQTATLRHVRALSRSRKIGGLVLSIDGQSFSSVQARLAAFARSLLPAALHSSVPVIIGLTNLSVNLREHEFGYWLHRQDEQLTICALCACRALSASTYQGISETELATVVTVTSRISP